MKRKNTILIFFVASLLLFSACDVEFSPNAEWKEVPVLYCVLDQDDDTTWVRVEKCFLGDGNMYQYGTISDSLNYPAGSISVKFYAYQNGRCVDTDVCNYTVKDREDGAFANRAQPLYYTTNPLNENYMYKLVVARVSDNTVLAYTDSIPLITWYDPDGYSPITKPDNGKGFGFYDRNGNTPVCKMIWKSLDNARMYQPVVRFYYGEEGDTHYVDLRCPIVTDNDDRISFSTNYPLPSFLSELKTLLVDDPQPKDYLHKVDVYLTACSEDLNAYISSTDIVGGIDQGREVYTNIHNGVGVFASRRTHIYKPLSADNSQNPLGTPNPGLLAYLKSLQIGF